MNRVLCSKGHFYDGDKYSSCPHCASGTKVVEPSYFESLAQNNKSEEKCKEKKWGFHKKHENTSSTVSNIELSVNIPSPTPGKKAQQQIDAVYSGAEETILLHESEQNSETKSEQINSSSLAEEFSKASEPISVIERGTSIRADELSSDGKTVGFFSAGVSLEPPVGYLICVKGTDFGIGYPLKIGNNAIGRSQLMDVVITDVKVSREKQAYVMYEPRKRQFFLRPGEGNGLCYCNNEIVMAPTLIKGYDRITIGDTELLLIEVCNEKFSWDEV